MHKNYVTTLCIILLDIYAHTCYNGDNNKARQTSGDTIQKLENQRNEVLKMTLSEKQTFAISAAIEMRYGRIAGYEALRKACDYSGFRWQEYHLTLDTGARIISGVSFKHKGVIYWYSAVDCDFYYERGINTAGGESLYSYCSNMQSAVNTINAKSA